jgi:hypothetical protein
VPVSEFLRRGVSLYEASDHPSISDASRDALRREAAAAFESAQVQLACAVEILEGLADGWPASDGLYRELALALEMLSDRWEDGGRS